MQRSFDDLGTPLANVTFCVIDLETTGGSAADCGITEIGAVKVRGGECLGTLQTLVNPGCAIPPEITILTGISQAMVMTAPRIESVLPTLLEFIGDANTVVVGHNVRFDLGFINAALERSGRQRLTHRAVDTLPLARRLVRDEVPNCKLGTLVEVLRLDHRSSHRALDDALATTDLLHFLIERAGTWGVVGLDDLIDLPKIDGHPQAGKLKMTTQLPRTPGVYIFRDVGGRALYVGKATNLRSRVRSYFSTDSRRKVGQLLREATSIDHICTATVLEAEVLEVRLIHEHEPRFNRQAKLWRQYAYVKLTVHEKFPRLMAVKAPKSDGALYLGPLSSLSSARLVIEAVETVVPLRRCGSRPGGRSGASQGSRSGECTASQLGVALCPCTGSVTVEAYAAVVARAVRGLTLEPQLILDPLRDRMERLAREERFEEAASVRDRADALATAIRRQRRYDGLRQAGWMVIELGEGNRIELDHGRMVRTFAGPLDGQLPLESNAPNPLPFDHCDLAPLSVDLADELGCIAAFLDAQAHHVTLIHCDGPLSVSATQLPSFTPTRS